MRSHRCGMLAALICLAAGLAGKAGAETMAYYRNMTADLPVAFEYPMGWEAEPSHGGTEPYRQVQVYAPKAVDERLRCYVVVRRVEADGGAEALAATYRKTLQPGWAVDSATQETLLGAPAIRFRLTGALRLPWKSPKAQLVPVEGERIFVQTPKGLFELGWLSTPSAAPSVSAAFTHLLKTLTLT